MPSEIMDCCGLLTQEKQPIPLQGIAVDVHVNGFVADVSATLKYKNKEEKAVEAIFVFPMDEDSAVYSFEATVEGKTIVADLQEKEQAHKTYDEAISQGQQAFLLEEDESSGDIFSCSVGNLLPGQEAEVTLSFVQELQVEADGAVRFVLPAVLNPRYTPKGQKDNVTMTLPELPISEIPYTLSLTARFQSAYGIMKIESNCDLTPLRYTNDDKTQAEVTLAEGHKFDRDVQLLAYFSEVNKPSVTLEEGHSETETGSFMDDAVIMLNFYPSFPETQEQSLCGEFIFVVDRSGSMESPMNSEPNSPQRIQSAKETLVLLMKSLPLGCYFNIYGFGSQFESFFPESVEYTQQSMHDAVEKVNQMQADLGGTEILEPLKKIYETAGRPDHPRQVFIFTDGEVGNTKEVIAEVQRNSHSHRCFTFGIGEGASTALIKGVSRVGNGTYDFITGKDRMQPKVLKALKCALQPTVKDVSINWALPPDVEVNLISHIPIAIYRGQRSIIYAVLKGKLNKETEGEVTLQYKFKDEIFSNQLKFPLKANPKERPTIHRLAAKSLISQLETELDSDEVKKRILETSLQSGVISSLTAFVAVNKDSKALVEGPPVRRFNPPIAMACSMPCPKSLVCYFSAPVALPDMLGGVMDAAYDEALPQDATDPSILLDAPPFIERDEPAPVTDDGSPKTEDTPALFRLISLQNADGSWKPSAELASILGTSEDFKEGCPDAEMDPSVWATILALIWLHSNCLEQRDEWELLELKAIALVKAKAGSSLDQSIKAGVALLKSSVDPKVFGF
ncbi:von Willebrand factor A domain-containing protein 5A-like isoform X2 [Bufo bufo]|uniref:von Willebrand factor A domain-containing protein 5A-like isoform X2 n=1 Tax=Bufo bufo TaxID=8384 RepID=UPI001ABDA57E|nr:von Willebrand factor A domain-containing protein 5A-like isoform X2 [Bufo bufo]